MLRLRTLENAKQRSPKPIGGNFILYAS